MDDSVLLGIGRRTVSIAQMIWKRQVRGDAQLDFMTEAHHRVRNFAVTELPRAGEPLAPGAIAQELALPREQVLGILDDLERNMTFLFRNENGAVEWAYPVTVAPTRHRLTFSTGEQVNAA